MSKHQSYDIFVQVLLTLRQKSKTN